MGGLVDSGVTDLRIDVFPVIIRMSGDGDAGTA